MMEQRPRGDIRDTSLDVAEIGNAVRQQLKSLYEQTKDPSLLVWSNRLQGHPASIQQIHRSVFALMRAHARGDAVLEDRIVAWQDRLAGSNQ